MVLSSRSQCGQGKESHYSENIAVSVSDLCGFLLIQVSSFTCKNTSRKGVIIRRDHAFMAYTDKLHGSGLWNLRSSGSEG